MLTLWQRIFHNNPLTLPKLVRRSGKKVYKYLAVVMSSLYQTVTVKPLLIPVQTESTNKKDQFVFYRHRWVFPPERMRFKNRYFPNDYSEIEQVASRWNGTPSLKASVIVASYNQKQTLKLNLLAWVHQTYPQNLFEVIVADDGSSDGTQEMVKGLQSRLPYSIKLYSHEDKGFRLAKVRNEGVAMSSGEIVIFVDGDTIPSPDYIWEHMKYYHVSNRVAVVGMRQRIENTLKEGTMLEIREVEALKGLARLEDMDASEKVRNWRRNILFNNLAFRKEKRPWGGFHGTLTSCRKRDFQGVGGNDENFHTYGLEDTEMGFRLLGKVQYLVSNPEARLYHLEHPSNPNKITPQNLEILKDKTRGPKVTVYIIAIEEDNHIEDAIQSVLQQTMQDFELIIVNDGSSDKTDPTLEKYRYHPKIRIYEQFHKGHGAASNVALMYARGQYICPFNQNDLLMPHALEILAKELDRNTHVGFVYSRDCDFEGKGLPLTNTAYQPGAFIMGLRVSQPRMWRMSCFNRTEGFSEDVRSDVDLDISLKLEEVCQVKKIQEILYKERIPEAQRIEREFKEKTASVMAVNQALKRRGIGLVAQNKHQEIVFMKMDANELQDGEIHPHKECPLCGDRPESFLPFGAKPRPNARCPKCGSLERHRLLWLYFREKTNLFKDHLKMLHVAPERQLAQLLKNLSNLEYLSADLESPHAMVKMDITNIQYPDHSFDVIVASHVFEHIPDDGKAMRELYRVLKPGGWAILQVPIWGEKTFEDPSITTPEARKREFGQHDHVRRYGWDGKYRERLENSGFLVKVDPFAKTLGPDKVKQYGLQVHEDIYYCEK